MAAGSSWRGGDWRFRRPHDDKNQVTKAYFRLCVSAARTAKDTVTINLDMPGTCTGSAQNDNIAIIKKYLEKYLTGSCSLSLV